MFKLAERPSEHARTRQSLELPRVVLGQVLPASDLRIPPAPSFCTDADILGPNCHAYPTYVSTCGTSMHTDVGHNHALGLSVTGNELGLWLRLDDVDGMDAASLVTTHHVLCGDESGLFSRSSELIRAAASI